MNNEGLRPIKIGGITFKPVDYERHREFLIKFREDSFIESFGSATRFYEGDGRSLDRYVDWLKQKSEQDPESEVHIWLGSEIIGQMELGTYRPDPSKVYINLYYLVPERRGQGYSASLERYSGYFMKKNDFEAALLSVSPTNKHALSFYSKNGGKDLGPRPDQPEVHLMEKCFSISRK